MSRHPLDFYQSGAYQVRALLHHQPVSGTVLEPCVGNGDIASIVQLYASQVVTNDIDRSRKAHCYFDAASPTFCQDIAPLGPFDWVISNPPYEMPQCLQIVQNSWELARVGVIMQARISFKEPTKGTKKKVGRGPWLRDHPISRELTLPRHSFTGDGKSDNATTSWFIWLKQPIIWSPALSDLDLGQFGISPERLSSHVSLFDAARLFAAPNEQSNCAN